ncbi:hypothetical protein OH76DRAFT_1029701 [Lentinus brumalis]|uniref:Uncharacterized protein n=1 Tax=Lentinus brumalis TaxID=2498619 RepID=A0A371CXD4_9APHY|nr:hypothetical protein OH76DRAFT_1029701 [Polyporus brumalis]
MCSLALVLASVWKLPGTRLGSADIATQSPPSRRHRRITCLLGWAQFAAAHFAAPLPFREYEPKRVHAFKIGNPQVTLNYARCKRRRFLPHAVDAQAMRDTQDKLQLPKKRLMVRPFGTRDLRAYGSIESPLAHSSMAQTEHAPGYSVAIMEPALCQRLQRRFTSGVYYLCADKASRGLDGAGIIDLSGGQSTDLRQYRRS